jgi:ABC-type uncharacterized transport system ATPase subunit
MIKLTGPNDTIKLFQTQDAVAAAFFVNGERELVSMYVDNYGHDTETIIDSINGNHEPDTYVVIVQKNNDFASRDINYRLKAGVKQNEVAPYLLDSLLVADNGKYVSTLCMHESCCPTEGKSVNE